jgi:predicted methyltransferase
MMENELKGKNVELEVKPWLDNLFYCLVRGAWHAPIIMINGKKFYQFSEKDPLFDRDKLVEQVKKALES